MPNVEGIFQGLQIPSSSCHRAIPPSRLGTSHPTISPHAAYQTLRNSSSTRFPSPHNLSCNTYAVSKSHSLHHCVLYKCDNRIHGYGPDARYAHRNILCSMNSVQSSEGGLCRMLKM